MPTVTAGESNSPSADDLKMELKRAHNELNFTGYIDTYEGLQRTTEGYPYSIHICTPF